MGDFATKFWGIAAAGYAELSQNPMAGKNSPAVHQKRQSAAAIKGTPVVFRCIRPTHTTYAGMQEPQNVMATERTPANTAKFSDMASSSMYLTTFTHHATRTNVRAAHAVRRLYFNALMLGAYASE